MVAVFAALVSADRELGCQPTAMENTCRAPPWTLLGSVTLRTCLPGCSVTGAVANRYTGSCWGVPLTLLRYGILATTRLSKETGRLAEPPSAQSEKPTSAVWVLPSV